MPVKAMRFESACSRIARNKGGKLHFQLRAQRTRPVTPDEERLDATLLRGERSITARHPV
jgi:hypothetical protein